VNLKPIAAHELAKPKLYGDQAARVALEPRSTMTPRCPKRLSSAERKAWKNVASILKSYGLFVAANALHLELLAQTWVQYLQTCTDIQRMTKGQLFLLDGNGIPKENPILRTQQRIREEISQRLLDLGLGGKGPALIGQLAVRRKKEGDGFFEE
jgi:P27 family predicted phage terminase small subunit